MLIQTYSLKYPLLLCAVTAALLTKSTSAHAQPIVEWAKVGGSAQGDTIRDMTLSRSGEIYLAGFFDGDGSSWATVQTVLYKYDPTGGQIGSLSSRGELIESVALDSVGNYHVTGRVWRPEDLGMGVRQSFYFAKYSSSGTLLWERAAGASAYSESSLNVGFKVLLDAAGNSYVAGGSHGPGIFGNVTFPNTAGGPLLCKYDPDGTLLWAKRAEGKWTLLGGVTRRGGGYAWNLALDANGNIVISGEMWNGTANFGGIIINIAGPYAGASEMGAFIAKYSPAGQVFWAKPVPYGGVAVDHQGNIVINGSMTNGLARFDGTAISIDDPSGYNSFVAKYNPAGELLWAKAALIGGLAADQQGSIYSGSSKLDPAGNLTWERTTPGASLSVATLNDRDEPVFTGALTGAANLDGHVVQGDGDNYDDFVVCKADRNGKFQWAFGLTSGGANLFITIGNGNHLSPKTLCDDAGNVYVAGYVSCVRVDGVQSCDGAGMFGGFPLSVQFGGNNDLFIARITDPVPVSVGLKIERTASGLVLSWPASFSGFVLETADAISSPTWTAVTPSSVLNNDQNFVPVEVGGSSKYFRLRNP